MKQKTHSGLKKRIKVKKSGKLFFKKACKNHLLANKSKSQKRAYRGGKPVDKTVERTMHRLMPNS